MSNRAIDAAIECEVKMTLAARMVLFVLANRTDKHGLSWPGLERIAREAGLTRRAVINAIASLERLGLLAVEHHRGRSHTNRYRLLLPGIGENHSPIPSEENVNGDHLLHVTSGNGRNDSLPFTGENVKIVPRIGEDHDIEKVNVVPRMGERCSPEPKENLQRPTHNKPEERGARARARDAAGVATHTTKTAIPDPFVVTKEMVAWGHAQGMSPPFLHDGSAAFVNWASEEKHVCVDWGKAWRLFMLARWNEQGGGKDTTTGSPAAIRAPPDTHTRLIGCVALGEHYG